MKEPAFATAEERVLPTLNPDGSRRWITPKLSPGRFLNARRWVGWSLIAIFVSIPWIEINGRPAIWLNIPARQFTFAGHTFIATDTLVLMLTMLTIFIGVFFITAIFGRVWCGWGCPQTVYMELLFRPVERALERWRRKTHSRARSVLATVAKYALFLSFSITLAHTFLAYFVGVDALREWITRSPIEHPGSFIVMVGTVGLMMFDFSYFREQMCTVICPYARLQSALLDRDSLLIGYDPRRGEPRDKHAARELRKGTQERQFGDCIDCHACVHTCPTGIDIRDGLQLECIGCAQCIDACDRIMDSVGAPRGLIRYSSERTLEQGQSARLVRFRTIIYFALLLGLLITLVRVVGSTGSFQVELLRLPGASFTVADDGRIQSTIRFRIANRSDQTTRYTIAVTGSSDVQLVAPINPFPVSGQRTDSTTVFVFAPPESFEGGSRQLNFEVRSDNGDVITKSFDLLGPSKAGPTR